ncbi:MAG: LptA/OstA family protein [Methyloligella sp. ZOD6]
MISRWQSRRTPTIRPSLAVVAIMAGSLMAACAAAPLKAQTIIGGSGPVGAKPGAFKGLSKNSDKPIDIASERLTVYDAKKVAVFTGNVRAVQGDTTLTTTRLEVYYKGSANPLSKAAEPTQVAENQGETTRNDASDRPETSQGPASQLAKIEAKGNVVIRNAEDQSATGDRLLYDVETKMVTLSGNVSIKSDKDQTTKSDSAVYDMAKETVTVRDDVVLASGEDQTAHSDWAIYDVPGQMVTVGGNVVLTQGQNVLKGSKLVINLATGESRFENSGDAAAKNRIRALFMPNEGGKRKSAEDGSEASEDGGPTSLIPRSN